jgi:manganese oxidase
VMGERGMAEMGEMEMPLPDNTLPMMGGKGPFGPIEMGGMFTVVKVRKDLARNDYNDPGWYQHPTGTAAYELNGTAPAAQRSEPPDQSTRQQAPTRELRVRKPRGHAGH